MAHHLAGSSRRRTFAGLAAGLVCFLAASTWCFFVVVAITLAEVAPWKTYLALSIPTIGWAVLSFILGRSIALGRRKHALIAATVGAVTALIAIVPYFLARVCSLAVLGPGKHVVTCPSSVAEKHTACVGRGHCAQCATGL